MDLVWARVMVGGQDVGAGIVLAARSLVTAAQGVRDVAVGDADADLTVAIGDAPPVKAVLAERADAEGLALLTAAQPIGATVRLPLADSGRAGDGWSAPAAGLAGDVDAGGDVLELRTGAEQAGDGGPGGPVFARPDEDNRIIGILTERTPDGTAQKLTAAAIASVLDTFESLRSAHLLRTMLGAPKTAQQKTSAPKTTETTEPDSTASNSTVSNSTPSNSAVPDSTEEDSPAPESATPDSPAPDSAPTSPDPLRLLNNHGVIDPEVRGIHHLLVHSEVLHPAEAPAEGAAEPQGEVS